MTERASEIRVWYLVRDLERALDFYKRMLGFEETVVDWELRCAKLEHGPMRIALAEGEPIPENGVALIDVEDARAEADRLRAESVDVGTVVEVTSQMRLVDVFDPDGNRIQLAQSLE